MAANQNPIFPLTPNISWTGNLTTGTNNYDGTSGVTLGYTAGANGSFLQNVIAKAAGTNVQTVLRIFINNGSANGTAANNAFFREFTLAATTASSNSATQAYEFPMNILIPAGYRLYAVLATTVAAGFQISFMGGDY
jgi:hypothetical protein